MNEIKIGYGNDLYKYKTKSVKHNSMDITIKLGNGDLIDVNCREFGYALRFRAKGKEQQEIKNINY